MHNLLLIAPTVFVYIGALGVIFLLAALILAVAHQESRYRMVAVTMLNIHDALVWAATRRFLLNRDMISPFWCWVTIRLNNAIERFDVYRYHLLAQAVGLRCYRCEERLEGWRVNDEAMRTALYPIVEETLDAPALRLVQSPMVNGVRINPMTDTNPNLGLRIFNNDDTIA